MLNTYGKQNKEVISSIITVVGSWYQMKVVDIPEISTTQHINLKKGTLSAVQLQ